MRYNDLKASPPLDKLAKLLRLPNFSLRHTYFQSIVRSISAVPTKISVTNIRKTMLATYRGGSTMSLDFNTFCKLHRSMGMTHMLQLYPGRDGKRHGVHGSSKMGSH